MSREPKNNEEGFMYKLASFIVDKRNLIFLIVAIGLVFSVFSRNWVQVENQRSAVGMNVLPGNIAVEIEALVSYK